MTRKKIVTAEPTAAENATKGQKAHPKLVVDRSPANPSSPAAATSTKERRCAWCDTVLPKQTGRGRPRTTCSEACKQAGKRYRAQFRPEALAQEVMQASRALAVTVERLAACDDERIGRQAALSVRRCAQKLAETAGWMVPAEFEFPD